MTNKIKIVFEKIRTRDNSCDVTITRSGPFVEANPELGIPAKGTVFLKEPNPEVTIEMPHDPAINIDLAASLQRLTKELDKLFVKPSTVKPNDPRRVELQKAKRILQRAEVAEMLVNVQGFDLQEDSGDGETKTE